MPRWPRTGRTWPQGRDPRVVLEVVIALGPARWPAAPDLAATRSKDPDAALAHAAMQACGARRTGPLLLALLDEPDAVPVRALALRAVADRYEPEVVDGLIERLQVERDPSAPRVCRPLTRVFKKPGPGSTGATGRRRARRTRSPGNGPRRSPRRSTACWPTPTGRSGSRCSAGCSGSRSRPGWRPWAPGSAPSTTRPRVAAILDSLSEHPAGQTRDLLGAVVRERRHSSANRLAALAAFVRGLDESDPAPLLALAQALEDGPVLPPPPPPPPPHKLNSPEPVVRAAAIAATAELRVVDAGEAVGSLLRIGTSWSAARGGRREHAGALGRRSSASGADQRP